MQQPCAKSEGLAPSAGGVRRAAALSLLVVGLAGGQAAARTPAAGAMQGGAPNPVTEAFGYTVGEERRYVLGPPRSLRSGESATWSIVLERIDGEGEDMRIVFALEHERSEVIYDIFGGTSGRMQTVNVDGQLTVNRFGFPERLVIGEQLDVHGEVGSLSDLRTTVFRFDGERFVKEIRINGRDWDFNINIITHDDLDLAAPAGLFAYVPTGLRCLGARGEIGRPVRCSAGDPAFANPGLLDLALPLMWEEQVDEKEFLFLKPAGVGTLPGGLIDMNRLMARERDQLANNTRYWDKTDLRVEELVERVEIGPRYLDAWRIDGSGEMGDAYLGLDGKVLKVTIDPHPITHGERWIRLLFASEY